jgi:NAD-dependent deacetylase
LHQRAGQDPKLVIELHGTMIEAECLSCHDRIAIDEALRRVAEENPAPECEHCGGWLKQATISFGQAMPALEMERARLASEGCDVFLAVGSSLVVYPAALLPRLAKQSGARLLIINRTPTPMDEIAEMVIREEIGTALPRLISGLAD